MAEFFWTIEYTPFVKSDFLKSGKTVETIMGALQTYSEYEYSIIDRLLFEQLVIDYKNAIGDREIVIPKSWNTSIEVSTKESLEFNAFACTYNKDLSSSFASKKTNDLSELLATYAQKFEELAQLKPAIGQLDEAKSYVSSRSNSQERSVYGSQASTLSINGSLWESQPASPISDFSRESSLERYSPPKYGSGQRVPAENLYMDWTKSFVRRGGSSAKSDVK